MNRMKTFVIGFCTMLWITAPALALDITDYIDPDLQYQDAELQANFYLRDGNQDQTSYNGLVRAEYDMEYSTLPLKWEVYAYADVDFFRGGNDEDSSVENYRINGWTSVKKYLKDEEPFGLYGFGRLDLGYRDLEDNEDDDPYAHVLAGVGYGRVITATPLMEAYRCVEDLQKYSILKADVPDDVYLKLAAVIAKENEYKSRYSLAEYEKYWYEDMEKVFQQNGVIATGNKTLGAMGIIRIQDILLDEGVLKRKHGWEVEAGIGYLISDYSGNDGDPSLNARLEYAKPFGFKWQLIERLTYSTILVDWEFGDADHSFLNELSLNYEITDRVDWTNEWDLNVILASEGDDTYINGFETGFRYYITNTIDALTYLRFDHKDQGDDENDDVVTTFYLGIAYTIF